MQHQDWEPVVFRTKKPTEKAVLKSVSERKPGHERALTENTESFANKMFERDYIQEVIRKRVEKKWSQKDLAIKMNLDVSIVQRLEQGREVYDGNLKNKLNRILGISTSK